MILTIIIIILIGVITQIIVYKNTVEIERGMMYHTKMSQNNLMKFIFHVVIVTGIIFLTQANDKIMLTIGTGVALLIALLFIVNSYRKSIGINIEGNYFVLKNKKEKFKVAIDKNTFTPNITKYYRNGIKTSVSYILEISNETGSIRYDLSLLGVKQFNSLMANIGKNRIEEHKKEELNIEHKKEFIIQRKLINKTINKGILIKGLIIFIVVAIIWAINFSEYNKMITANWIVVIIAVIIIIIITAIENRKKKIIPEYINIKDLSIEFDNVIIDVYDIQEIIVTPHYDDRSTAIEQKIIIKTKTKKYKYLINTNQTKYNVIDYGELLYSLKVFATNNKLSMIEDFDQ